MVHYTSHNQFKRANSAFLITAFSIVVLKKSAEEAFRPFVGVYPPFIPFRDASYGVSTFNLSILDCLRGLSKAIECKIYDYLTFDLEEFVLVGYMNTSHTLFRYTFYEQIQNGDMNWIVPGKLLAFSGPSAVPMETMDGLRTFVPEDYHAIFKKWKVNTIIRLNKKVYDRRRFSEYGFQHYDLYFLDGSVPSDAILSRFLEITENNPNAAAIHCKAGLGRTGSSFVIHL